MKKNDKTNEELLRELESLKIEYDSLKAKYEKDITTHKKSEEEVRDAEERFQMVFENLLDGISIYSEDPDPLKRKLIECNERLAEMAGRSREELLKLGTMEGLYFNIDENSNNNRLESLKKGTSFQGIFSWIRPDGKENIIEFKGTPVKWRGKLYTIGIDRDITEHKKNEEALEKEHSLLRTLIDYLPSAVFIKDEKYRKIIVNPIHSDSVAQQLRQSGLPPIPDILGKTDFEIYPKELAEMYFQDDQNVIRDGKTILNKEETGIDPQGGPIWVLVSKIPLKDKDGSIKGMVGITTDITNQKRAEEEIIKANGELKRINSVKDKFFSIIAHDLKSPFQGLVGMTGMMAEDIYSFTQAELSEFSVKMHKNVKNLLKLLTNLLDWARMQQGTINYDPVNLILSKIVSQNINLINKSIEQKNIEIISDIPNNKKVYADEEMLNSILGNLLSNAVKFTSKGGKIKVTSKETANKMIEIAVQDTGVGMSKSLLDKLFKMEEHVGRKGTEGEESTGLGLLLCKEFVEKNGGKIWVETKENEGSTFYFTLSKAIELKNC